MIASGCLSRRAKNQIFDIGPGAAQLAGLLFDKGRNFRVGFALAGRKQALPPKLLPLARVLQEGGPLQVGAAGLLRLKPPLDQLFQERHQ